MPASLCNSCLLAHSSSDIVDNINVDSHTCSSVFGVDEVFEEYSIPLNSKPKPRPKRLRRRQDALTFVGEDEHDDSITVGDGGDDWFFSDVLTGSENYTLSAVEAALWIDSADSFVMRKRKSPKKSKTSPTGNDAIDENADQHDCNLATLEVVEDLNRPPTRMAWANSHSKGSNCDSTHTGTTSILDAAAATMRRHDET